MTAESRLSPEEMLQHSEWMYALAVSLVGDRALADDIVQGAWTAAVESPPRNRLALGGWLRTVVRNLATMAHRQESRRRRRETAVARPERQDSSTDELVERAELRRSLVEAVLSLREPYRSTVILRFFEGASPQEIADRDGVPRKTVFTRLRRAMEQLRAKLSAQHGGEESLRTALIPWLTAPVALPGVGAIPGAAPGTWTGAKSASASSAIQTSASSMTSPTIFTIAAESIAVMSKSMFGVSVLVSVVAGALIGRWSVGSEPEPTDPSAVVLAQDEYEGLKERSSELESSLAVAKASAEKEEARSSELSRQLEQARGELESLQAASEASELDLDLPELPLGFGQHAESEAFRGVQWQELAGTVAKMTDLLYEATKAENQTGSYPASFEKNMRVQQAQFSALLSGLVGQVESHAQANAELTHPLTLANIIAAMLEREGLGFSEQQHAMAVSLGRDYEERYKIQQSSYTEETTAQRKVLDELKLKRETMGAIEALLTPAQRDVVIEPYLHGRFEIDPRSPVQMLGQVVRAFPTNSRAEMEDTIRLILGRLYGLSSEFVAELEPAIEEYFRNVELLLVPIPSIDFLMKFHIDDGIAAGEAFSTLLQTILEHPDLAPESRERILNSSRWPVPRIRAQE